MKRTLELFKIDTPNINGVTKPRSVIEAAIDRAKGPISKGQMVGEVDANSSFVRLAQCSHRITDIRIEEDRVMADIEVFDTEAGKNLTALVEAGIEIKAFPIGRGTTHDEGKERVVIYYDFGPIHVWTTRV